MKIIKRTALIFLVLIIVIMDIFKEVVQNAGGVLFLAVLYLFATNDLEGLDLSNHEHLEAGAQALLLTGGTAVLVLMMITYPLSNRFFNLLDRIKGFYPSNEAKNENRRGNIEGRSGGFSIYH